MGSISCVAIPTPLIHPTTKRQIPAPIVVPIEISNCGERGRAGLN
jgi:hypothetical protein